MVRSTPAGIKYALCNDYPDSFGRRGTYVEPLTAVCVSERAKSTLKVKTILL